MFSNELSFAQELQLKFYIEKNSIQNFLYLQILHHRVLLIVSATYHWYNSRRFSYYIICSADTSCLHWIALKSKFEKRP